MTFIAPLGLALFALAVPLIALYLLKQKRQDRVVPSTLLWEKVLSDIQARHPFQKLRANLLLLLELAVLAALALALARPAIRSAAEARRTVAIVLDASASMQARDEAGGRTRFEAARAAAADLVAGLRPGDRAMLVLAGRGARTAKSLTAEQEELLAALRAARAEDVRGELGDAVLLAAAALRPLGGGEVAVFGDGGGSALPAPGELQGVALRYHAFGTSAENVGITGFEVIPGTARRPQAAVFVTVENAGDRAAERFLGLYESERLVAARDLVIPPRGEAAATFEEVLAPGVVSVRLEARGGAGAAAADALAADDAAWAVIEPPAPLGVAIFGPSHIALERGLLAAGQVEILTAAAGGGPDEGADGALAKDPRVRLCVFDGVAPAELPPKPCLVFGPRGDLPGVKVGEEVAAPAITGWERDHPLLRFVDLAAVEIARARPLALDGPGRVLVRSDRGPLVLEARGRRDPLVVLGMDIRESTWAGSEGESFVIFLLNVLKAVREAGGGLAPPRIATGAALPVAAADGEEVLLVTPGGETIARRAHAGKADFVETGRAGIYRASAGGRTALVAANLLERDETRLAPRRELPTAGGGAAVHATPAESSREVWRFLAALALIGLVAEWWVFHRRL